MLHSLTNEKFTVWKISGLLKKVLKNKLRNIVNLKENLIGAGYEEETRHVKILTWHKDVD